MATKFSPEDVYWIIEADMLMGTLSERLGEVIINNGNRLLQIGGQITSDIFNEVPFMDEGTGPILLYGSHRFIKAAMNQPWYPGTYPEGTAEAIAKLDTNRYMVRYADEDLLNANHVFACIDNVIRNPAFYYKILNTDQLFIKDTDAFKEFQAKVCKQHEIVDYLKLAVDVNDMSPSSLIMLSPAREISSEHRFVIVDGTVVAHSTYMMNGCVDIRIDVPKEALALAKKLAKKYNPSSCYTLDIAMEGSNYKTSKPKLLEINSFSCAGLYACDLEAVVKAVNRQALEDYYKMTSGF